MRLKRLLFMLCVVVIMGNVPVSAGCVVMEEQGYTEKQVKLRDGTLTFWTKGEPYLLDYRCIFELNIKIKESKPGILKDGDVLYFKTSKDGDRYFSDDGETIKAEGLEAEMVKIPVQKRDNHFAIRISRKNIKQKGTIDISISPYLHGIDRTETENLPTFSLWIDADATKENNLFSEDILLNDCFMDVLSSAEAAVMLAEQRQQKLEKEFPKIVVFVGTNCITWNGEQRQLNAPVYINQNGSAMFPLDNLLHIIENFGGNVTWSNQENGYIVWIGKNMFLISLIEKDMKHSEGEIFKDVLEEKEDIYYISLRSAAKIFGMENYLVWNDKDKTISIGAKF